MKNQEDKLEHIWHHILELFVGDQLVLTLSIVSTCIALFFLTRTYLNPLLIRLIASKEKRWKKVLTANKTLNQLSYLFPVLFLMAISPYDQKDFPTHIINALVALNVTLLLGSGIRSASKIYELYPIAQQKPIKSYAQLLTLLIYVLGGVLVLCQATDTNPTAFLGGAVAIMAGILLVFRDTILSFIASMQIAANNLIQKGDWVEVPAFGADGDVVDIALHVIRVQNFDKTIVTIPTYKIMETGFKNWRGMFESGGRQIKKSIYIDQNSIRFMTDKDIDRLYKHPMIQAYLPPVDDLKMLHGEKSLDSLTNLGILRTYLVNYLKASKHINQDMTILVRVLEPTPSGVPLQTYAYTNDTRWFYHEHIKGDIIEHIIALLKVFDLRVFQNITDTNGKNLEK